MERKNGVDGVKAAMKMQPGGRARGGKVAPKSIKGRGIRVRVITMIAIQPRRSLIAPESTAGPSGRRQLDQTCADKRKLHPPFAHLHQSRASR